MKEIKKSSALFLAAFLAFALSAVAGASPTNQEVARAMNQSGGLVGDYQLVKTTNLDKIKATCPAENLKLLTEDERAEIPLLDLVDLSKCGQTKITDDCVVSKLQIANRKSSEKSSDYAGPELLKAGATKVEMNDSDHRLTYSGHVDYVALELSKRDLTYTDVKRDSDKTGIYLECTYKKLSEE